MTGILLQFRPYKYYKSARTGRYAIHLLLQSPFDKIVTKLDDVSLSEEELKAWDYRLERLESLDSSLNQRLDQIRTEYQKLKLNEGVNFYSLSLQRIHDTITLTDRITNASPVLQYIKHHYENAVLHNGSICAGTRKNYNKAINHFNNFLKFSQNSKIRLMDFSRRHAFAFWDYLLSSNRSQGKTSMQSVSATSVIKKIKAIFQRAYEEELIGRNPFGNLPLVNNSKQRDRLRPEEIVALIRLELAPFSDMDKVRDAFLFSAFTGLAYGDISRLEKSMIKEKKEGYLLESLRHKTQKSIRQYLPKYAVAILNKYSSYTQTVSKKLALPVPALEFYNKKIKEVAAMAGIEKIISTHIARHSCMQLLVESGNENAQIINCIMGWSNRNNISAVYYNVTEANLLQARNRIETYLDKYLNADTQ
jgi:site-specific recombinase XerD